MVVELKIMKLKNALDAFNYAIEPLKDKAGRVEAYQLLINYKEKQHTSTIKL